MPLTQTQLASAVAERAELTRADAKRALEALEAIVLEELNNAQKVRIAGLVQLTVRVKPAQKARMGRNPATGEQIKIAAKPASVDVRARPLARAKAALPSVQKARRRLAADAHARDRKRSPGRYARSGTRVACTRSSSSRIASAACFITSLGRSAPSSSIKWGGTGY